MAVHALLNPPAAPIQRVAGQADHVEGVHHRVGLRGGQVQVQVSVEVLETVMAAE